MTKLFNFINLISEPSYKLHPNKAQKHHSEFMSFCLSVGNGKILVTENPNHIPKKDIVADLAKITEWRDTWRAERERLENQPEETNVYLRHEAMKQYAYCMRHLELFGIVAAVTGNIEKKPLAVSNYGILVNKADEILAKIN